MATECKCDFCTAAVEKNATLVHTERKPALWDLDCSLCPDCSKQFKAMLEKVKSQKSWTGWTALEQEVASLKKENESLKSELRFLRQHDPTCDELTKDDSLNELVTLVSEGGATMKAHRSILMSRSAVLKTALTSDDFKRQQRKHANRPIELPSVPRRADSFRAFIQFLYTAKLEPEILKNHAPELMEAGNKNAIELLTRKCEDYIVNNMTDENAIHYLQVAEQCKSTAIRVAAVKQIQSNSKGFVDRDDFKTLRSNPTVLLAAFGQILLDSTAKGSDSGSVSGSEPGLVSDSVPGSEPFTNSGPPRDQHGASHMLMGTCNCSVHPLPHPAPPGSVNSGWWPFQAATAHTSNPASAVDKLQQDQRKS